MGVLSKPTNKYIITCDCKDTPRFAQEAFSILFPKEPAPMLIKKRDIPSLSINFENTDFGNYLNALYNNKEKFSHFFEITDGGEVVEQWDLQKGVRIL